MLHVTKHVERKGKQNKMGGMTSINTSTVHNPFCQMMRQTKRNVCASCYAHTQESFRKKVVSPLYFSNSMLLSGVLLKDSEMPTIKSSHCRFNSFGEIFNLTHFQNLLNIAMANPQVTFALWTKRLDIVKPVLLPNLIYVYSSPQKNVVSNLPKGFDKVFTVFSKPFIRENNVDINCELHCATCLKCYTHNGIVNINEALR